MRNRNRTFWTGVASIAAAATLITGAPSAKADVFDDAFLDTLDTFSVPYGNAAGAIDLAHTVCEVLDETGAHPAYVGIVLAREAEGYWTLDEAGYFVGAAIGAYCPEHMPAGVTI